MNHPQIFFSVSQRQHFERKKNKTGFSNITIYLEVDERHRVDFNGELEPLILKKIR